LNAGVNAVSAQRLLKAYGFGEAEIKRSEIPYRG
jgi:hypothetical protein